MFLGELLCFWLRSSFILHVKMTASRAAPELLRKSGAKGVSLEGKFGWAALERLRSSSWAAPEQLRSQVEQGGAQKVKCVEPTWAALEWLIAATFCAPPCSAWLRSCSRAATELLWSCSRAAHLNLPSKLNPLAPLLRSSSGAAPLAINFTCKIKLLRSQKWSILPINLEGILIIVPFRVPAVSDNYLYWKVYINVFTFYMRLFWNETI